MPVDRRVLGFLRSLLLASCASDRTEGAASPQKVSAADAFATRIAQHCGQPSRDVWWPTSHRPPTMTSAAVYW
jgi:hypothetical protein